MQSTSIQSRRSSSISPSLGASAPPHSQLEAYDLREDSENIPSVSTAIRNLVTRHSQEIRENVDTSVPRIGNSMKKTFRDFFMNEASTIFDFLEKPLSENKTLSQSYQILKRFGKGEYSGNKNKIKDLVLDTDCTEALEELNTSINSTATKPLTQWIQNTKTILEQWKIATNQFSVAEKRLQEHMKIFDEVTKRITNITQLPQADGYSELVSATEIYLKSMFEKHHIETNYNEVVKALKKIVVLTDSMNSIRHMINSSSEPLCSVCFQEPVGLVSVPCGHTFCTSCGGKQVTTCYICRVTVKERVKIYFS